MTNIITENVNPREQNDTVEELFLLDRWQTSFANLFALTENFVKTKDISNSWVDFFAGGVGTTLQQLMAGHSEYDAYQAITLRRESYLFEARIQSSAVGIASAMGYSSYRGQNQQLLLTIVPSEDIEVQKFSIVGGVGEYDIISLENKSFKYGDQSDLKVTLGKLMQEEINVPDAKTHFFRFSSPNVSEDIALYLNNSEIPYSKDILELLNDEFIVLSNAVGGVDVFYLNRHPPDIWRSLTRYTYFDYISPSYGWRKNFNYKIGDHCISTVDFDRLPTFYKCVKGGYTYDKEPVWNTEIGSITIKDGLEWECIGKFDKPRYFSSRTPGIAESGLVEPVWPVILGEKVTEGDIDWYCVDTFGVSRYPYDTGDKIQLKYVESENVAYTDKDLALDIGQISIVTTSFGYDSVEEISSIRVNAPLFHETQKLVRGREDYRKLFRLLTPNIVDANGFDVSPAVVRLTYVKDHTYKIWDYNLLIDIGTQIMPRSPNNFIYRATTAGRTTNNIEGRTGVSEPNWDVTLGDKTYDNEIIWEAVPLNLTVPIPTWSQLTQFTVGNFVKPIFVSNDVMFQMVGVSKEPNWPTTLGETVKDNDVTWECFDTIFLTGYEADWYVTDTVYQENQFVKPANPNGYFYRAKNTGVSSLTEPDWPTVICDTVIDGTIVWECYDLLDSTLYVKNRILEELPKYRPYGVEPNQLSDPKLVSVEFDIILTLKETVDIITASNDVDILLGSFQKILGLSITANDIENLIEQNLDYVYVARAVLGANSKTRVWGPGLEIKYGDVVVPTTENGFFYKAQLTSTTKTVSYTAWEDKAYSSATEPDWPTAVGERIEDGYLVWEMRPRSEFSLVPSLWQPNFLYLEDSSIVPNDPTIPVYAKVVEIKFQEPLWPTVPGKSIKDNDIFWVCLDPNKSVVPLAWDEYYIFTRNVILEQK